MGQFDPKAAVSDDESCSDYDAMTSFFNSVSLSNVSFLVSVCVTSTAITVVL